MIEVNQLSKSYGEQVAVNALDLSIDRGEFYGLLGPNGAGKTTTIGILSTLLEPDSGTVTISGLDIAKDRSRLRQKIGVVPQEIALYEDLSAEQNLKFFGRLYGLTAVEQQRKANELIDWMGLTDRKRDAVKTYSGGMKRRINLAIALMHNPDILFLDEPTVGIDPQSKHRVFEVIERLREQGKTMIYTTHYMQDAERFCDRIGIIDEGKVLAEGSMKELMEITGQKGEELVVHTSHLSEEQRQAIAQQLDRVTTTSDVIRWLAPDSKQSLVRLMGILEQHQVEVKQIEFGSMPLETIFLQLTGKKLRD